MWSWNWLKHFFGVIAYKLDYPTRPYKLWLLSKYDFRIFAILLIPISFLSIGFSGDRIFTKYFRRQTTIRAVLLTMSSVRLRFLCPRERFSATGSFPLSFRSWQRSRSKNAQPVATPDFSSPSFTKPDSLNLASKLTQTQDLSTR